ncbi:MAG: DUF192 domain-containing protein [Spirochaetaceae bacterium]|jgi:uncharacterized membrane protein (UPF0127 family)|nr:DUF192 domain-containing protein [Spirochaetaceae bacterium]
MNFKKLCCPVFLVFTLCTCRIQPSESRTSQTGKPQTGLETSVITINSAGGPVSLTVELARTETQRNTGLMYRTELEDGKGMLFIFERDQVLSFWMKNTFIPLSIAYISYDGTIIDIRNMYPHDTSSVHSSRSVRYALEVPQGWFAKTGINAGNKVSGL